MNALATLDERTLFQRFAESVAHGGNFFVAIAFEEILIQQIFLGNAMRHNLDHHVVDSTLGIFTRFHVEHIARTTRIRQTRLKLFTPLQYHFCVVHGVGIQRWQAKHFMQHFQRHQVAATTDGILGIAVVLNQLSERFIRDGRCFFGWIQRRFFQRDVSQIAFQLFLVLDVLLLLAALDFIQRWLSNVDVTAFNQLRHLTEEEGQQQRTNVRTIDVRIGHDDDTVITQLVRVVLFPANTATQCGDQCADFRRRQHFVKTGFFDIQNLTLQRQDCLGATVTALLGRTASGVTLHQVHFRQCRIFFLTVGQFARQASDIQRAFATSHFTSLASGFTSTRRIDHFTNQLFCSLRVLFQILLKQTTHLLLNCRFDFTGYQFVFGLGAEFWIRYFHRDDGRQTFTGIVTGRGYLVLLVQTFLGNIGIQGTGQCSTETGQVSTAVTLRNVVGVAEDIFLEAVVPLHRHFNGNTVFALHLKMEDAVQGRLALVQEGHERGQTSFKLEGVLFIGALVF